MRGVVLKRFAWRAGPLLALWIALLCLPGRSSLPWNIALKLLIAFTGALVLWTLAESRALLYLRKLRQVFGNSVADEFYVFHTVYKNAQPDTVFGKPETQVTRRTLGATGLQLIASLADARAAVHLANELGRVTKSAIILKPDHEDDDRMGVSFVATGASNHRSFDVLTNSANGLLDFTRPRIPPERFIPRIRRLDTGKVILSPANKNENIDYGLIVKVNPDMDPSQTWICCAGFGEWGTSGAAWYLAHRWKEIREHAKNKPFACITRTQVRSDESTVLLGLACSVSELNDLTSQVERRPSGEQVDASRDSYRQDESQEPESSSSPSDFGPRAPESLE